MTTAGDSAPARKVYRRRRFHRVENAVTSALARTGLMPYSYVLTTIGRKSGQPRSNPVGILERDGRRWLVAPYGPVPWVLNARAAGQVSLTRRRTTRNFRVPYFSATRHDPPEAFAREASAHPVFELLPANG